jgi:hypothetical protein
MEGITAIAHHAPGLASDCLGYSLFNSIYQAVVTGGPAMAYK